VPTLCLVCGLAFIGDDSELPWGPDGESPTFNFCPCCGVEFGYGDFTIESVRQRRSEWVAAGHEWRQPDERPAEWDLEAQLARLPERVR